LGGDSRIEVFPRRRSIGRSYNGSGSLVEFLKPNSLNKRVSECRDETDLTTQIELERYLEVI